MTRKAINQTMTLVAECDELTREKAELVYMLKDMVGAFAKFAPKSIKHPRAFTFNQARALLSRLEARP